MPIEFKQQKRYMLLDPSLVPLTKRGARCDATQRKERSSGGSNYTEVRKAES